MFHRNERNPNPMLGYTPDDFDAAINTYMPELSGAGIIADINATIDYLQRTYPRTRGQKIGIVGYCMGGRVVYLAAGSCSGLSAGVVYYGGAIMGAYSDGVTPIDGTANISIPLMGNFGDTDANPTPADVAQIAEALTAAGKAHDFKSYPDAWPRLQLRRPRQLQRGRRQRRAGPYRGVLQRTPEVIRSGATARSRCESTAPLPVSEGAVSI